jgi:hypothetical protein
VLAANLVSKGLSGRPKTAARAAEALLLLVELNAAESVLDSLFKAFAGKVPKAVAACVDVVLQALRCARARARARAVCGAAPPALPRPAAAR